MIKESLEIDGVSFNIEPLTVRESLKLSRQNERMNFFEFIKSFIDSVTSLDEQQISMLKIQSAIAIMAYHRMYFLDNEPVSSEPPLSPSDFIHKPEDSEKEIMVSFDGYRFSNQITLSKAIDAERLCHLRGDTEYFSFYILASCCTKSLGKGVDTVLNRSVDTREYRLFIKQLNSNISNAGLVSLDFLQDTKSISLITNDKTSYFPLDNSSFFLALA